MRKRTVVIGLLGPVLDRGDGPGRWERWRPTVALCQHEDFVVDRLELLFPPRFQALAKQLAADIGAVSPETTVQTVAVDQKDPWDFEEVYSSLHEFARSYPFDVDKEEYFVHITTGTHVAQICLFLLTESRYFPATLLQTAPAARQKGTAGVYSLIDLDLSKYDRIASRFRHEARERASYLKSGIETLNPQFNQLIEQIEQVALHSKSPLLLMGPTGAGKSLLARRVFELKKNRRQLAGAFVEVNCATLRGDAAMSALFGHVKGAFTGAVSDRPGLLRAANGGVLFLDEVGELGLDEQAMLLRAIEEKRFLPVGSDKEASSDFQLITGTNRDLGIEVREKRFREDLLARINIWTFRLPRLAERREDIEPNLDYELEQFAQRHGTRVTMNKEARARFLTFARSNEARWEGNFRDLNAAVTRLGTLATGGRITAALVDDEITRLKKGWSSEASNGLGDLHKVIGDDANALDLFTRLQLAAVLRVCRSSRTLSEAGRLLFAQGAKDGKKLNHADRLRKYLSRFGIDWRSLMNSTRSGLR